MAVAIRLKRFGSKKKPHWRVVVADQRSPRDGKFIEEVGYYKPQTEPAEVNLKMDRIDDWISKGAQPSVAVKNLIKKSK